MSPNVALIVGLALMLAGWVIVLVAPRPVRPLCLPCFAAAIVFAVIGGAFAS